MSKKIVVDWELADSGTLEFTESDLDDIDGDTLEARVREYVEEWLFTQVAFSSLKIRVRRRVP